MARAYIGLGSNLGDKRAMVAAAVAALAQTPGIVVAKRSADYRTPPWGDVDQDWFVNACAALDTSLAPPALLEACLSVETRLGRRRSRKWGPRLIDIDVIDYDGTVMATSSLALPHPHALRRPFVLVPLAEIAPDLSIAGTSVREALSRLDTTGIERLDG